VPLKDDEVAHEAVVGEWQKDLQRLEHHYSL
jgi:hypothetical protein